MGLKIVKISEQVVRKQNKKASFCKKIFSGFIHIFWIGKNSDKVLKLIKKFSNFSKI